MTPLGGPGLRRAGRSENVKEGSRARPGPAAAAPTMAETGKLQLFVKVPSCLGWGAVPGRSALWGSTFWGRLRQGSAAASSEAVGSGCLLEAV